MYSLSRYSASVWSSVLSINSLLYQISYVFLFAVLLMVFTSLCGNLLSLLLIL
uniref:Uncharacterized protein n=1 Tax=Siphoviridae sp. ctP0x5 TaxID=2827863 RepID=A0A8S5TEZ4_9CAUD|nr:MAG TPA: hypothetical protein [Siphoviridae sp. ctP0x5]